LFTFVISKIQKKYPGSVAMTPVVSVMDNGPYTINITKESCLSCFPWCLWWNCSYSFSHCQDKYHLWSI